MSTCSKLTALQQLEMHNHVYVDSDDCGVFQPLLPDGQSQSIYLRGYTMDTIEPVMDVLLAAPTTTTGDDDAHTAMSRLTSMRLRSNTLDVFTIAEHLRTVRPWIGNFVGRMHDALDPTRPRRSAGA